ncbi:hypothetical protein [Candidatus Borrarchaeum sp.]|uniref:hypothetical protein n=1 Tax=Candidatus Borrarchaeum sp. TaxID=2846742 RepID=UPI00257ED58F|nr:hypothetical protein [Candidatus Borrarchaeum sp.]
MPGRKLHLSFGFIFGCFNVILSLYLIKIDEAVFSNSKLMILSFIGLGTLVFMQIAIATVASIFPDFLEPATSKYHRGFFHSQFILAISGLLILLIFLGAIITSDLATKILSVLLSSMILGYLSHLLLDYPLPRFTKKKRLHFFQRW